MAEEADKLAAFQEMLDKQPEREEADTLVDDDPLAVESTIDESDDTEQLAADDDSGAEIPAEEAKTVSAEGPSFLMKRAAIDAGIPEFVVNWARDDAQLQQMLETIGPASGAPVDAAEEAKPALEYMLPEDEFGADDPMAKQVRHLIDTLNSKLAEIDKKATAAEEVKQTLSQREQQAIYTAIATPFDEVLDSFQSDVLGTAGSLTPKQERVRFELFEKYKALGAAPTLPADRLKQKARVVLQDDYGSLVEQKQQQERAKQKQAKTVLGGGQARNVQKPLTHEDKLKEFQNFLDKKKQRATT
jgi:hypothetical protein